MGFAPRTETLLDRAGRICDTRGARMTDLRREVLGLILESEAPTGAYDLLLCRNVLLYFSPERRQSVFDLLARHSHDRSVLLLGAGETVIGQSEEFVPHPEFRGTSLTTEN